MSTGKLVTALSLSFKRLGKYGEFFTTHRTLFTASFKPRSTFQSRTCPLPHYYPHLLKRHLFTMKIDTEDFKSVFTDELIQLKTIFEKYNYEIRFAGGPVRDLLMNIKPHDLDFATTATPQQMKDMFNSENIRMINLTGEKHGTITVRINEKENFEITTLRIDVINHGRHAVVEFTQDWELDANRRDLTVNSMFLGFDGTVYDYCGGWDDLQERRVAFVGDAQTRIQEDYLRILRYFRFCARISPDPNVHEPDTEEAIRENIEGLSRISGERIWLELKQILSNRHAGTLLETMLRLGIGPHIGLGDKPNMEEFRLVLERARSNNIQLQPISLLASLLDSEEAAVALHERLKYPNFDKELSFFIVHYRDLLPEPLKPLRPYHMIVIDTKQKMKDAILRGAELLRYQGQLELANEFEKWVPPRFPVGGADLKSEGVPTGKAMNMVIQRLRSKWKESDFQISHKDLVQLIPNVMEDLGLKVQK